MNATVEGAGTCGVLAHLPLVQDVHIVGAQTKGGHPQRRIGAYRSMSPLVTRVGKAG